MGIAVRCRPSNIASSASRVRWLLPLVICGCLVFGFRCEPAGAQTGGWIRQPVRSLAWLHGVFFLDENQGWAVGSKGAFLATVDGGKSWQVRPSPTEDALRDIYFSDDKTGWVLCEANLFDLKRKEDPRTYLMQTTDAGDTWKRVNILGADVNARLVRTIFSGGRGWAFGEEGAIFTTRDLGLTWSRLKSPTRHLLLGGTFIDDDRGWLVGAGATIIQTADGGETWHISKLVDASRMAVRFGATSFVGNRLGWAWDPLESTCRHASLSIL